MSDKTTNLRLTELAHHQLKKLIRAGDTVIDASAGNGHDTLFLARQVSASGKVLALDIQAQAIAATRKRLQQENIHWVELIQANHGDLAKLVPLQQRVRAIVFNLGYLPGSDKRVVTQAQYTLKALQAGLDLLDAPAIISILCYRGHDGGMQEYEGINDWLSHLDTNLYRIEQFSNPQTRALSPVLVTITID